jgi:hypothetical protein
MSKGKQPRTRANKVPKLLLSEIKEVIIKYVQGIGLEAAIFWRSRNRALVHLFRYILNNLLAAIKNVKTFLIDRKLIAPKI